MNENQKLREALHKAKAALSLALSDVDWRKDSLTQPVIHKAYNCAHEALALPPAVPESLEALSRKLDTQTPDLEVSEMINGLTQAETDASASVSGLTAAPVDERERFEQFAQNCPMGKYNVARRGEGYDSSHTQIMWDAWQARAALSAGDAVDAQRLDFIEKSARCDPKMDGQHVWWPTSFNTAQLLKGPTLREALDNAIRARKDNT